MNFGDILLLLQTVVYTTRESIHQVLRFSGRWLWIAQWADLLEIGHIWETGVGACGTVGAGFS